MRALPTWRVAAVAAAVATAGLAGAAIVAAQSGPDKVRTLARQIDDGRPKNVIMLLGDGMGDSEITAARYYFAGARGRLRMDEFPFTGEQTTWSLKPGAGPDFLPDYVPDSAATGTAWSTGNKTIDERISQGPSAAVNVPGANAGFQTVLELASRAGMRTGDVSTAEITDATPAVLASHISNRACQGPADTRNTCPQETKAAGGLGSIAEQEVDHGIDVILGGGKGRFDQALDGSTQTVTEYAQADRDYRLVTDAAGLGAVGDLDRPILGLFNRSNMSLEYNGPTAALQQADGAYGPPVTCQTDQRPATEPSLADMTTKALDLLSSRRDRRGHDKGFFLQVEGASIDKRDHAANPCQQIGETIAFDKAIGVALDYQRAHPDTLVVLTADHGHTSQIVAEDANGTNGPTGYAQDLRTKDGAVLRIAYGTAGGLTRPSADTVSQQHTGTEVRVAAIGPQAARVTGIIDETDINGILTSFARGPRR
jgi:alkaline phosphatase